MGDPDWFDAKAAGWWAWGASCWIGGGWCDGAGPWQSVDGLMTDRRVTGADTGKGVSRRLPHLGDTGKGVNRKFAGDKEAALVDWFGKLAARLASTRVACGDWTRVCGPSVLRSAGGITGVFLDPPYDQSMRSDVYAMETPVARDVLAWCRARTNDKDLRIVLTGYLGEHDDLQDMGWRVTPWKTSGGYANQGDKRGAENASKERIWFSPQCLDAMQGKLI